MRPEVNEIARKEISLLLDLAGEAGVSDTKLRHELHLSQSDWQRWLGLLDDAPLPAYPALALMLRHMGFLNSRLDRATRHAYA